MDKYDGKALLKYAYVPKEDVIFGMALEANAVSNEIGVAAGK